ncbi:MAG TPA: cytochrome c biogenesis protein CcdA [Cyclobacteriaceae bacterium]|nr:cytochrome c biogenesis protein CcdA [Cyclobacteriaceae bacterium]
MLRRLFLSLFLSLFFFYTQAQLLKPAKWTIEASKQQVSINEEVELIFRAKIDANWHMYANGFDPDCGPILTEVTFNDKNNFSLVGELKSINPIIKHDETFGCEVKFFNGTAEFRQKVKITGKPISISGIIECQVCSDIDGKCISLEQDFLIDKITVTGNAPDKATTENTKPVVVNTQEKPVVAVVDSSAITPSKQVETYGKSKGPTLDKSILGSGEPIAQNESLLGYMIIAFLLGITSLITPCVFPMIPMTVTFFLKDGQTKKEGMRKAIFFGLSIIAIYTLVGTAFALIFGAEGLNALATHWLPNLLIFVIFIIFALSFLGLFEITAPHKLVNSADRAAEKGGWGGIFFMSATLVLVSFSCTIPLVGNVLVLAAGGEIVKPIMGMFAYSFAFAIPFTLFAFFPEWLKGLPKSGGWLNAVKVTLGLLELALSLKFFSIADQTYHWGLLDRDINIAIWVVIFSFLAIYFLGKIRLPHDSVVEKVTVPRLLLSIATFSFVAYLIPGLWGAPLKGLAGYLPPMYTHDFDLVSLTRGVNENEVCDKPKYADFLHLPHGLQGYFDYEQALACARQQNKPIFIDFTGHGCTNCREMEAVVWSDPQVLHRLQNDFVVVALYVDDKTELPEAAWYTSAYDKKVKKTIGKQNADLQIANLDNNAQPFYVLVGKDERVLAWPHAYDKNVQHFIDFLDKGKAKYKELYSK